MKKWAPYIASVFMGILAVSPPVYLRVPMVDHKGVVWLWLIAGAFGIYTLFIKTNLFVKLFAAYLFLCSILSTGPYISLTGNMTAVAFVYFFILSTQIEDWRPVRSMLKTVLILNLLFVVLQQLGKDSVCNWSLGKSITCWGTVGNAMQFKSVMIIAFAALIGIDRLSPYIITGAAGALVIVFKYYLIVQRWNWFLYARGPVLIDTIKIWTKHPIVGWGPGLFKSVFPAIAEGGFQMEGTWRMAHNCWAQLLFETGIIGFLLMAGLFVWLGIRLARIDKRAFLGLGIIAFDMMVHFPTRQIQCTPIMVLYLAYCDQLIRRKLWRPQPKAQ